MTRSPLHHRAPSRARAARSRQAAVAALCGVACAVVAPRLAQAADGPPSAHRVDAGLSSALLLHDCACDGYSYFEGPLGFGARLGYRYRATRWLDVGVSPSFRAHSHASTLAVPLLLSPGWSLGRPGGESRVWLSFGGGFARSSGDLAASAGGATSTFRQLGGFVQLGVGGAVEIADRWSLFGEASGQVGAGIVRTSGGYPAGYIEGQNGTWLGGTLDLGVRRAL